MAEDKCRKVMPNPELQRWHKQFNIWADWIKSKEYAAAFQAYYKHGSVPSNQYPAKLIRNNDRKGTVEIARLNGVHEWKGTQEADFLSCAIYNEQLAKWKRRRERETSRQSVSSQSHSLRDKLPEINFPFIPFIGWALFIVTLLSCFVNAATITSQLGIHAAGFLISGVFLAVAFFRAGNILTKITHVLGCISTLSWGLPMSGLVDEMFVIFSPAITLFTFLLLASTGIRLLAIRLKAGAAGYGWNEGSDWYSERKKKW